MATLTAKSTLGDGISCKVDIAKAIAEAGLHPATGGDGTALCSGDMLLEALVGFKRIRLKVNLRTSEDQ